MTTPGTDPNYQWLPVKFLILLLLLPLSLLKQAAETLFDYVFPKPLRWVWDNGSNPGRKKIDCWGDLKFPDGFLWGTATASHQIEGGCTNNNWYKWENEINPETGLSRIARGVKCGRAADHWNRVREDVQLMKDIGCNSYRFSVEWSKIEPVEGQFDEEALKHYQDELDLLLKNGIKPMLTLHHFTDPLWFCEKGGWEKKENIAYFLRFSERVYEEFCEQVPFWCTFNEPTVFALIGWLQGSFPPGKKTNWIFGQIKDALTVTRNMLIAHVEVYKKLKAINERPQIGMVHSLFQLRPFRRWNPFEYVFAAISDLLQNDVVLQFLRTGHFYFYLPIVGPYFNLRMPEAPDTLDFIGVNYYSHMFMAMRMTANNPLRAEGSPEDTTVGLMTDMDYPMYAEGFYLALKRLSNGFPHTPIYVTENGVSDNDDSRRRMFIKRYLYAMSRAIQEGCDVRGYFYWTLMDNFEWASAFDQKFGLYSVDYGKNGDGVNATLKRHLRPGSEYFRDVVKRFTKKSN